MTMRFCKYLTVCAVAAAALIGCRHTPSSNVIPVQGRDFGGEVDLETYDYTFNDEVIEDSLILVSLAFPEGDGYTHDIVPWGAGTRVWLGYSFAADTVYFACAFSQDIRRQDDSLFVFRRKFKPQLTVYMARSHESVQKALGGIFKEGKFIFEDQGAGSRSLAPLSQAVPELGASDHVWVMAHRAHTSDPTVPENSVAAVNAAVAAGADIVETDTHITADGQIVICHDQTIDATTNGSGDITKMTLEEIRSFNLTDRNGNVTDEKMPTLEEFLLAARDRVYVNLDYSPRTASTEQVMEVVERLGMTQQVFMYCNKSEKIDEVFARDGKAHAYCRCDWYEGLKQGPYAYFVQARWKPGIPEDVQKDMDTSAAAVKAGCLSSVNMLHVLDAAIPEYEINDDYLRNLLECFPDCRMIQTDCPDLLVPKLKEMGFR